MASAFNTLSLIIYFTLWTACHSDHCDSKYFRECPVETRVVEGDSVTLRCITRKDTDTCMWEYTKGNKQERMNLMYAKNRFVWDTKKPKNCSVRILRTLDQDHTQWKCCPFFKGLSQPPCSPPVKLIVAKEFKSVSLYNMKEKKKNVLRTFERSNDNIVCEVKQARPRPLITWYIYDKETQNKTKLGRSLMRAMHPHGYKLTNIDKDPIDYIGTFNGTLTYLDHKKNLECVVGYEGVDTIQKADKKQINLEYNPKFVNQTVTVDLKKKKVVKLEFMCNPPPATDDILLREPEGRTIKYGEKSDMLVIGKISCQDELCHLPIEIADDKLQDEDMNVTVSVRGVEHVITIRSVETIGSFSKTGLAFAIVGIALVIGGIVGYVVYKRRQETTELGMEQPGSEEKIIDPEETVKLKKGQRYSTSV